ncbi:iron ABC transporter permease [Pelistega sp. MC2]|uniref:ABC transporter permease n=1 Tax=Pelistega sp. MC2 TaxID=1720297 RepID=UPI00210E5987|nr:iron ABC transporter permease [Pelistega sp. MC2]
MLITIISVLPTVRLVMQALSDISWHHPSSLSKVISQKNTWLAFNHSIYTSFMAMWVSLFLGGALAFFVVLSDIRWKSLWVFLFMLPMMIPPQVTALSWLQLMGPSSVLLKTLGMAPALGSKQPLYSAWGIILLMGIQHTSLVFLILRSNLLYIPKELIEAARLNGASQQRVFIDIIFPLCRNGLVAGAAVAFISGLGNFGIPAMLGIPVSYYVLPTLIYQKMADFGPTMISELSSLSLIIAVLAVVAVWVQHHFQNKMTLMSAQGKPFKFELNQWRLVVEISLAVVLLAILVIPLLALLSSSFVAAQGIPLSWETFSWQGYINIFKPQSSVWRAFTNSFFLSLMAAVIIVLISIPLAYWGQRDSSSKLYYVSKVMMDIPYALPGVVLSIACILIFVKPLPIVNVSLYGTLWIILFAYLARFLTVGFKPIQSSMLQMDVALEEAAQLCGANFTQRLRDILIPLLAPSVFAGIILVFLIAFNELTVSALLWSAGKETVGVIIFNMDESGDAIMASAVSVVVVLLVIVLMLILSLLGKRLPKGVIPWQS